MRKVWLCIFYALCIFTIVFSLFWMALLFFLLLRSAGLTDPPVLLRCGPLLPERTITVESPSFIV